MFKIQWDATGERLYETGLDRGVLYTAKDQNKQSFFSPAIKTDTNLVLTEEVFFFSA